MIDVKINGVTVPAKVFVTRHDRSTYDDPTRPPFREETRIKVELRPEWVWIDEFDVECGGRACKGVGVNDDGENVIIRIVPVGAPASPTEQR